MRGIMRVCLKGWNDMYTLRDISFYTGLKVRTLRDWVVRGKLKAHKSETGYMWLVEQDELDRVIGELNNADEN